MRRSEKTQQRLGWTTQLPVPHQDRSLEPEYACTGGRHRDDSEHRV